MTSHPTGLIRH